MRRALLGSYTYLEFGLVAAAFLPILATSKIVHARDATPRIPGRWLRRFARVTARLSSEWRFSVEGDAPADIASRPYVVVANHESNADPFLLSFLPWDMRWVAKESLFKIPVAGWLLAMSGDIPLRRGDGDSVREMLATCRETLDAGLSVMLFPEGTRSMDGALQRFKDGAFQLAIDAQVPVLPVAVQGTRACLQKGSPWLGHAQATARILEPISTNGMKAEDVGRLRDLARDRIAAALPRPAPNERRAAEPYPPT